MEQKTTLEDIGENLDEIILDSKARYGKYYHARRHFNEIPEIATHSYGAKDFDWKERFMNRFDSTAPSWFDDKSERVLLHPVDYENELENNKIVEFNDKHRDNSFSALTEDEKHEMSLFHTMKQDPYFKHHLKTHLSKFAENLSDRTTNTMSGRIQVDPDEYVKFDRINLFDIRRQLPMRERVAILDAAGKAWGTGKRKESKAICNVKAGTGKVVINGKPLHMYFHQAWQRNRIMTPLIMSSYTCMLDVEIKVHGGGNTG